jgi:membrane protease YdiL (CAAX protease family)
MQILVWSVIGMGVLHLLNPAFRGAYPHMVGSAVGGVVVALVCGALMFSYRAFCGPRSVGALGTLGVTLGDSRRDVIREAAMGLVLQVILPLLLLGLVWSEPVGDLFALFRGLPEAAMTALAVAITTVLYPFRGNATTALRQMPLTLRAFPYLLVRAGVTEEVLFRGCFQTAAVRQFGALIGIALPVTLFSVGHIAGAIRLKRAGAITTIPWGAVGASLLTKQLPAAILLSLLWHSTGNLWMCIVLHSWIDATYFGETYAQMGATEMARREPCSEGGCGSH